MQDLPEFESAAFGDYSVIVGLIQMELHLPLCRSLKDKRGILKRTLNHLRKHHFVSVAEVAHQNSWGRAGVAAVLVTAERTIAENSLRALVSTLHRERDIQVIDYSIQLL